MPAELCCAALQIDDDVGVNVPALADWLEERRSQGNLYLVGGETRAARRART